jgi:hypothetical protein
MEAYYDYEIQGCQGHAKEDNPPSQPGERDHSDHRHRAFSCPDELRARDAIPALTLLLNDHDHSHVDDLIPVAEAARQAIARIESGAP